MRYTLDARLILPQMTGIGRYLFGLMDGMREVCHTDQLQVWLQSDISDRHPVWQLNSGQVNICRTPLRHMDWRAQWLIPQMLRRDPPDLLHYPHFDLPWLTPGKIVLTIHDLKYIRQPSYFRGAAALKAFVMKATLLQAVRRAQAILVDSQFTARDLVQLNVAAHKIHAVPLGVGKQFFQRCSAAQLSAVRQRYCLPENYILTVGERRPHKNLSGMIQAFARFQASCRVPYQLVIVGKPYAHDQTPQMLVEKIGISDRVKFLDYVQDDDLPALYQMSSAFLLLSFYEGFGLPVLEAMASGAPVIASDSTALPEVVGQHGCLVNPSDPEATAEALRSVLTPDAYPEEKLDQARQWAQTFTWQRCAAHTLQIYQQVART